MRKIDVFFWSVMKGVASPNIQNREPNVRGVAPYLMLLSHTFLQERDQGIACPLFKFSGEGAIRFLYLGEVLQS